MLTVPRLLINKCDVAMFWGPAPSVKTHTHTDACVCVCVCEHTHNRWISIETSVTEDVNTQTALHTAE